MPVLRVLPSARCGVFVDGGSACTSGDSCTPLVAIAVTTTSMDSVGHVFQFRAWREKESWLPLLVRYPGPAV